MGRVIQRVHRSFLGAVTESQRKLNSCDGPFFFTMQQMQGVTVIAHNNR